MGGKWRMERKKSDGWRDGGMKEGRDGDEEKEE